MSKAAPNTLDMMAQLCTIQEGRIAKLERRNSRSALITRRIIAETQLLAKMRHDLAQLQLATGILPRAPGRLVLRHGAGQPQTFEWTETDERLLADLQAELGRSAKPH